MGRRRRPGSAFRGGRLGVSRADQFIRPAMMPRYDCDEEVDPDERPTEPGIAEDDNFFD